MVEVSRQRRVDDGMDRRAAAARREQADIDRETAETEGLIGFDLR